MQPDLPRPVQLTAPKMHVVSEWITNPCRPSISFDPKKFNDDGTEKLKRPKCDLSERDNPDCLSYTYLDRFIDEMKEQNAVKYCLLQFYVTTKSCRRYARAKRYIKQLEKL